MQLSYIIDMYQFVSNNFIHFLYHHVVPRSAGDVGGIVSCGCSGCGCCCGCIVVIGSVVLGRWCNFFWGGG